MFQTFNASHFNMPIVQIALPCKLFYIITSLTSVSSTIIERRKEIPSQLSNLDIITSLEKKKRNLYKFNLSFSK
jgi:hypothetical protein